MNSRPRTQRAIAVKRRRCSKCGKMINNQCKRCKACHQKVK